MLNYSVKRFFYPRRIDDLVERAKEFIGKEVTVLGWHENIAMREEYPEDEWVGFVEEFYADIPKSELLVVRKETDK